MNVSSSWCVRWVIWTCLTVIIAFRFTIHFGIVGVVDDLSLKFTNDLTVKSITAVKAECTFNPWICGIAETIASAMNVCPPFWSIDDVGSMNEVAVA